MIDLDIGNVINILIWPDCEETNYLEQRQPQGPHVVFCLHATLSEY